MYVAVEIKLSPPQEAFQQQKNRLRRTSVLGFAAKIFSAPFGVHAMSFVKRDRGRG